MVSYTLKVVEIRRETKDCITLCFKQPALRKVKYLAGQYLTLNLRINGRRYLRPYSFSSTPELDDKIEITVKRVLSGVVSNHINDNIVIGDSIECLSPMGTFLYRKDLKPKSVYFWGIGSGITPLFSLIKSILSLEEQVRVYLIYGNKNEESTIFLAQINQLIDEYASRFTVFYFYSQSHVSINPMSVFGGRIMEHHILQILSEEDELAASIHYICGLPELKQTVKSVLYQKGMDKERIFVEDFELIKNPEDFVAIETQTVMLFFEQIEYALEVVKGKSVLEAALDASIELPYSCQIGDCSTCKAKLTSGSLTMIGLDKQREDLKADEFLLCCSHPLTNDVYIEV